MDVEKWDQGGKKQLRVDCLLGRRMRYRKKVQGHEKGE